MSAIESISDAFAQAHLEHRAALMPYYPLGYPNREASLAVVQAIAEAGADLIELGAPFSDPLADGPVIQHAARLALQAGTTLPACLEMVAELRRRGVRQPLLLMGYYNPILSYGPPHFVEDAAAAGLNGLIIPDLPPEEAGPVQSACEQAGLAQVFLLPPNATPQRVQTVTKASRGFLYLVSLTGVTGARQALPPGLARFVEQMRGCTDLPLAVGFGISTPQQAAQVGRLADGVIVGSALVKVVTEAVEQAANLPAAAGDFVRQLKQRLGMVQTTKPGV